MRLSQSIPFAAPIASEDAREALVAGESEPSSATVAERHMDEAAFRAFYEETAPRLRAYLRRVCGNAALADDLVQEAFYRFLRADLPSEFSVSGERWQRKAYLYRTANSLLADHWRRTNRERRWRLLWPFGSAHAPEQQHDDLGDEGNAMRLFRRLGPREQTLLWLAYVEGFDHREIAAALQIREKSVRVLLFRARKRLREIAGKEGLEL